MIKIERIFSSQTTILRNGVRQPVTRGMTVSKQELESMQGYAGKVVYTVDEQEIKEIVFPARGQEAETTERDTVTAPEQKVMSTAQPKVVFPKSRK